MRILLAVALLLVWAPSAFGAHSQAQPAPPKVDPSLPPYRAQVEFPMVKAVGSDTLFNLLSLWTEGFSKFHPNFKMPIEAKGSNTAPPALTDGLSQLAPMSREMKAEEVDKFERKRGYKPTKVAVAIDAIVVFVNPENKVPRLSLPQVDAIFSKTRKGGYPEDLTTWGQLGLGGDFAAAPIALFGRNSLSGTYTYFLEHALYKGAFKLSYKDQSDSMGVVWAVAGDKFGIGYSGIGPAADTVRFVPLSAAEGRTPYEPTTADILKGNYPLSRRLFIYIDKAPNRPLTPLVKEFLRFVLSKEGQEVVANNGFVPLDGPMAKVELDKLD